MVELHCNKCGLKKRFNTSKYQNYNINRRIIYRMRLCDQGHRSIQTFPRLTNVPVNLQMLARKTTFGDIPHQTIL